jgi:hypothetical protein
MRKFWFLGPYLFNKIEVLRGKRCSRHGRFRREQKQTLSLSRLGCLEEREDNKIIKHMTVMWQPSAWKHVVCEHMQSECAADCFVVFVREVARVELRSEPILVKATFTHSLISLLQIWGKYLQSIPNLKPEMLQNPKSKFSSTDMMPQNTWSHVSGCHQKPGELKIVYEITLSGRVLA